MPKLSVNKLVLITVSTLLLNACVSTEPDLELKKSYLQTNKVDVKNAANGNNAESNESTKSTEEETASVTYVAPFSATKLKQQSESIIDYKFSDSKMVKVTADNLSLKDYLHYVMGELLDISYVLGESINQDKQTLTLNLQDQVSKQKLFNISEKLLNERGYVIKVEDKVFYIHKKQAGGAQVTYGYGNQPEDVPNVQSNIIQLVPFVYGGKPYLVHPLSGIAKVKATADMDRNSLNIEGKRAEIIKALEFIQLMDQAGFHNRIVGVYKTSFVSVDILNSKIPELLQQEGLSVGLGAVVDKALSIVTVDNINSLVFFANDDKVLNRALFWAKELDQPEMGNVQQYFIYQPEYSRAIDLGESLRPLLGGSASISGSTSLSAQNNQNKKANVSKTKKVNVSTGDSEVNLVIDERSNTVIISTTGERYRQLLPLIRRLDVMPKQVMLEVMIAEVTLTDEFKQGVEFAFNNGSYGISTVGAFMGQGFGGLSYALSGANIDVQLNMFASNSLVEVLSRPSLVVRDGVSATITVGTDIPIVGQTSSDPINGDKQTTSIEYRKTGIDLSVTPTINGQGVVMMEIKQSISTQVSAGSTVADSPAIFERAVQTEVVAASGQTVILGGLISKNKTAAQTKVPFLGDIPFIGSLFKGETDTGEKTELVILVTPRVIESPEEWEGIKNKFSAGLEAIKL